MFTVCCALYYSMAKFGHGIVQCTTDREHLYRIYSVPTHDKTQWLLLQFIMFLMMDAKGVRNMYSILVVVNKHNIARVASCWFIIYYIPWYVSLNTCCRMSRWKWICLGKV